MNLHGILLIDLMGLLFALWILNLVRRSRLHLGYALLWLAAVAGAIALVSVAALRTLITRAVGALFPASALALVAFAFIFFVLILFSVQLSRLAQRQAELVKALGRASLDPPAPGHAGASGRGTVESSADARRPGPPPGGPASPDAGADPR